MSPDIGKHSIGDDRPRILSTNVRRQLTNALSPCFFGLFLLFINNPISSRNHSYPMFGLN